MSKIFELFGYPLEKWTAEAKKNRENANCPFMNLECDGGGNRYLSGITLADHPDLQPYFPNKHVVQSGVCSLRPSPQEQPWLVCPRRLFSYKNGRPHHQKFVMEKLLSVSDANPSDKLRIWAEVRIKADTTTEDAESKYFDYTFDYVIAGRCRKRISDVAKLLNKAETFASDRATENGYTLSKRDGELWVEDFPSAPVTIVEVMTSSTSGGNKTKRTQIAMAFEDAVKNGMQHEGPNINYRQVWARMVSQLIVKSQVGIAWGGKTIWLLQDVLADYISQTTALDLNKYLSDHADEVNVLAFGYGDDAFPEVRKTNGVIELSDSRFFAGPISNAEKNSSGFLDIVKIGAPPSQEHLWRALFLRKPKATIPC